MDAARYAIVTSALGMTDAYLEDLLDVNRVTLRRWRRGSRPIPDTVADYLETRWESVLKSVDHAVDGLVQTEEQVGAPPESVHLSIYADDVSAARAGIEESAREHTSRVALVALVLEWLGHDVEINFAPQENAP